MITQVKVGIFNFTVTEVEEPKLSDSDERDGLHACVQYSTCHIQLRREMNADMKAVALLHELLHAIGRQSGLEYEPGEYTEEKFVVSLSHGLVALLRDNPALVEYLTHP